MSGMGLTAYTRQKTIRVWWAGVGGGGSLSGSPGWVARGRSSDASPKAGRWGWVARDGSRIGRSTRGSRVIGPMIAHRVAMAKLVIASDMPIIRSIVRRRSYHRNTMGYRPSPFSLSPLVLYSPVSALCISPRHCSLLLSS